MKHRLKPFKKIYKNDELIISSEKYMDCNYPLENSSIFKMTSDDLKDERLILRVSDIAAYLNNQGLISIAWISDNMSIDDLKKFHTRIVGNFQFILYKNSIYRNSDMLDVTFTTNELHPLTRNIIKLLEDGLLATYHNKKEIDIVM